MRTELQKDTAFKMRARVQRQSGGYLNIYHKLFQPHLSAWNETNDDW